MAKQMNFYLHEDYTNTAQDEDELIEGVYTDENGDYIVEKHSIPNNPPFKYRLAIKRADRAICHSWNILQEIKNSIVGEDFVAIEVYPRQSEVTDTANMYHLWVFEEGYGPKVSLIPPNNA